MEDGKTVILLSANQKFDWKKGGTAKFTLFVLLWRMEFFIFGWIGGTLK
ncbi:hypothetical protein MGA3_03445 [Bacillus methanolicus MGA3]|nr:hypothetical protein MGA3_03445 [Bacillus methanolicus MGA3]